MLPSEPFGTTYGRRITRYLLDNPRGTQVAILDLGGIVQEFSVLNQGRRHPLIASLPDAAAYAADRFQLNKQIGRVAGRIRNAEFELGGRSYRIEANENGHNLHGGSRGFGSRIFHAVQTSAQEIELSILVSEAEDGFPNTLALTIRYRLDEDDSLSVSYHARAHGDTVFDPTLHIYWLLEPELRHARLHIPHGEHAVLDADKLPTGSFNRDPLYDFSDDRPLDAAVQALRTERGTAGLDEVYRVPADSSQAAAVLHTGNHIIRIFSSRNGLVVYTAHPTNPAEHQAGRYNAIATEAQTLSDSLHHPEFGNIRLTDGQTASALIRYQISPINAPAS